GAGAAGGTRLSPAAAGSAGVPPPDPAPAAAAAAGGPSAAAVAAGTGCSAERSAPAAGGGCRPVDRLTTTRATQKPRGAREGISLVPRLWRSPRGSRRGPRPRRGRGRGSIAPSRGSPPPAL